MEVMVENYGSIISLEDDQRNKAEELDQALPGRVRKEDLNDNVRNRGKSKRKKGSCIFEKRDGRKRHVRFDKWRIMKASQCIQRGKFFKIRSQLFAHQRRHRRKKAYAMFHDVLQAEWELPAKPKATNPTFSKLYTLHPSANKKVKLPMVDNPVNSPASSSVLPMDADGLPEEQCDIRIEKAIRRDFEACANSVRALTLGSLFVRGAYVWASDLTSAEVDIPNELKDEIKKIAQVSAFTADAALDSFPNDPSYGLQHGSPQKHMAENLGSRSLSSSKAGCSNL